MTKAKLAMEIVEMPKVKIKRSKRDMRIYVDKWLAEHGLTRSMIERKAFADGVLGVGKVKLTESDFYSMAVGHRKESQELARGIKQLDNEYSARRMLEPNSK